MSEYKPFIQKLDFTNNILDSKFDLIKSGYENQPLLSLGFHKYLFGARQKMDIDEFKKRVYYLIVNQFESEIPEYSKDLNSNIPKKLEFNKTETVISRDFYKLWELITYFDLVSDSDFKSLSIGENGGFLQCIINYRNKYYKSKSDIYLYKGFNETKSVKSMKETKFEKIDGPLEKFMTDSELSNVENIEKFIKDNKLSNINLVTNNGSLEFIKDSNTEHQLYKLILGTIILALSVTNKNGNLVIRLDDCFTNVSAKYLNILYNCYKNIFIVKPLFSRSFYNEKYLVCSNFNLPDKKKSELIKKLKNLLNMMNDLNDAYVFDIATEFKLDRSDIGKLAAINSTYIANEHLNINKVHDYKNKKNYFGEQYHKFKDNQIKANEWWESTFIKNKITDFDKVRKDYINL